MNDKEKIEKALQLIDDFGKRGKHGKKE